MSRGSWEDAVMAETAREDATPQPVTVASVRPILKHLAAYDNDEITVGRLVELLNEAGFCVRRVV